MQKDGESKPKILVTEDDIENQKFLQLVLRKNFEIDICDSEQSFFQLLSKKSYDAIIMDISLKGGKNGVEIIKELKKKSAFKNIPVVCLSAHVFGQDRIKAKEAGVDAYLTKPVENLLLIKTLQKLIAQRSDF
jgi:CheY-like chemotaxis protein